MILGKQEIKTNKINKTPPNHITIKLINKFINFGVFFFLNDIATENYVHGLCA